jgi:hypothetical protein
MVINQILFYSFCLSKKECKKDTFSVGIFPLGRKTGSETSPPRQGVAVPIEAFFAYTSEKDYPA